MDNTHIQQELSIVASCPAAGLYKVFGLIHKAVYIRWNAEFQSGKEWVFKCSWRKNWKESLDVYIIIDK